ncbi:MAG: HAD family hydrolase [Planctomycetaceae bacterium]|nr:HAD family hydrolase [Planctomycetaceae bacterium]
MLENFASKPLLILDLDETLIHGSERKLHREADFRVGPFYLYKRPHLGQFLTSVNSVYDVAIWSSASEDYVSGIARHLMPMVGVWKFVWSRARCVQRLNPDTLEYDYIKDLRKVRRLGFNLNRTLIVDDTPRKVCRNYGNAIYVSPFEGSDADDELIALERFIVSLHSASNFRKLEKRGWRSRDLNGHNNQAR